MLCIQSYNVKPSPRPLGSGLWKIPPIPELFNKLVLDCFILVCHIAQYFVGAFLRRTIFRDGAGCLYWFLLFVVVVRLSPPSLLRTWLVVAWVLRAVSCNVPLLLTTVALEGIPVGTRTSLKESSSWPHRGSSCKGVHSLRPDLGCLWSIADLLQLRPGFLQRCSFNEMRR